MSNTKKIKLLFRLRSMETGGVQKVMCDIMKNIPAEKFDISLLLNMSQGEMIPLIPAHVKVFTLAKGREQLSYTEFISNTLEVILWIRKHRL